MTAAGRATALVRAVGGKLLNDVLKYVRHDVFGRPTYRLRADTIARASDEQIPLEHTQWRIWRRLLVRFHLFEVTDIKNWVAPIARFDTRGAISPTLSPTDTIRRTYRGELGTAPSGYVHMDLTGGEAGLRTLSDVKATCGCLPAGRFPVSDPHAHGGFGRYYRYRCVIRQSWA